MESNGLLMDFHSKLCSRGLMKEITFFFFKQLNRL